MVIESPGGGGALDIRPAGPADAALLAEIHIITWRAAYSHVLGRAALTVLDRGEREDRWRRMLSMDSPRHHVDLAGPAGRAPTGFAAWSPTRDAGGDRETTAELCAIYVAPASWRAGVGRLLMRTGLERARRDGFARATLWVVEENPRARAFYEREGWVADGSRRRELVLDTSVDEIRYATDL